MYNRRTRYIYATILYKVFFFYVFLYLNLEQHTDLNRLSTYECVVNMYQEHTRNVFSISIYVVDTC